VDTNVPHRKEQKDEDKLSPSDCTFQSNSPFKTEFSLLLNSLSTKALKYLLTNQQHNLAKALWEACNSVKNPTPADYRNQEPIDIYYKWVLLMEHEEQWRQHNLAKEKKIVSMLG
jgi:hypothetical protein